MRKTISDLEPRCKDSLPALISDWYLKNPMDGPKTGYSYSCAKDQFAVYTVVSTPPTRIGQSMPVKVEQ